ncbi:helix-turn-helix domain-containing protein [Micromonospora sp. NBS 11-29]|uniref:helix-turn-helix domain-containing protein n=1 Tax=Micromonospora sp. NBS 11-29 TaxID=1960879 RepID=UPI0020CD5975|nr:helix-turn-helix transcriptional regulator [Micromonospora sp. NBS 11-29]
MPADHVPPPNLAAATARAVAELRRAASLTMEDLADLAGLHRTSVGLVERGERSLTIDSAARLAGALGMRLSDLVAHAERSLAARESGGVVTAQAGATIVERRPKRIVDPRLVGREAELRHVTGLGVDAILSAIESTYETLDLIDDELISRSSPPISGLVELANLSSMIGNLLGAGVAAGSAGAYVRNRPHSFPDLVPQRTGLPDLEVKTALESNSPKGHLPKPGTYLTFRYVLGRRDGTFSRGREGRGDTVWVWEVRAGVLTESDFAISNTPGDSGKTAVIRGPSFQSMARVFYDPRFLPYARRSGPYGDDPLRL